MASALPVKWVDPADQDCSAWRIMNSEFNNSLMSIWNGPHQPVGRHSGLGSSTGFHGDLNRRRDAVYTNRLSQSSSNGVNVRSSYSRRSDAYNVGYSEAIVHVNNVLNQLIPMKCVSLTERRRKHNLCSLEKGMFCALCKKNREPREYYTTHVIKDMWGKVICPVLRSYVCPTCGATGDNAHTLKYCPYRVTEED